MTQPRDRIHRLARAVADGSVVDWLEVEDGTDDARERRLLDALGVLSQIAHHAATSTDLSEIPSEVIEPPPLDSPDASVQLSDGTRVPAEWRTVRLLELVGEGAFGSVFRGLDRALNLEVALKIIHPRHQGQTERILGEGRKLARLRHPNIVRVYGVDEHEGLTALRMEFVHGLTLGEQVREHGPLAEPDVIRIGMDVAKAVRALHQEGLVHRDVKSQNVMLEDSGRVVLMDLGTGAEYDETGSTTPGLAGTPMFLAPEILTGEPATPRSDVYAAGVLLFHLVTGAYPLDARDLEETIQAHAAGRVRSVREGNPDLSPELAEIIERAMAPEVMDRYASAEALARALAALGIRGREIATPEPESVGDTEVHPTNLPEVSTSLVGRSRRVATALPLIEAHRLLTLTGPGGVGKTRLAVELGRVCLDRYPDGVWFVELASIAEPHLIWTALGQVLGLKDTGARPMEEVVSEFLTDRELLIVLDNCEHLVADAAVVAARVLRHAASVRMIVTSREALSVEGEMVHPVSTLSVPTEDVTDLDALRRIEAVRLFVSRASAVQIGFALTDGNAAAVARICRRLDGIPLALELAAARMRALSPDEVDARLDERFRLLTSGRRDGLSQHRTLRAAIDWSHDQLPEAEQEVFRRLSVFAGGWTLEAAEDICEDLVDQGGDVVESLYQLITKSLVEVDLDAPGGGSRYRMLESIREYGHDRLVELGEHREVARTHRRHFLDLARRGRPKLRTSEQVEWIPRLSLERDNFLAALGSYQGDDPDLESGMRLLTAVGWLWQTRGYWSLARQAGETLLQHPQAQAPTAERANILALVGDMADHQGDYETAEALYQESLTIRRALDDQPAIAQSLGGLGIVAFDRGDFERARGYHEEALALARAVAYKPQIAKSLNNLATVLECLGDYEGARQRLEEGLALAREGRDEWSTTAAISNLGILAARNDDVPQAITYFEEVLSRNREMGERWGTALTLHNLAEMQLRLGDLPACLDLHQQSLNEWSGLEDPRGIAISLLGFGALAGRGDDPSLTVLFGATALSRLEELGVALSPADRKPIDDALAAAREALGEARFEAEWQQALAMPSDQVMREAMQMTIP